MLLTEELLKTFNPPAYILEEIEFDEETPYVAKIKTFNIYNEFPDLVVNYIEALRELLRQKYGNDWIENTTGNTHHVLGDLFWEFLKNSLEHGNQYDPEMYVLVPLWLGKKGLLLGFRDEGDFYKQQETKQRFEARKGFDSTRVGDPGGTGTNCNLNEDADDIFVDTQTGTLYLSYHLTKKFRKE